MAKQHLPFAARREIMHNLAMEEIACAGMLSQLPRKLIVMRHGQRIDPTEELTPESMAKAKEMRALLERRFGQVVAVLPSDYGRTQNTAKEMGYADTETLTELSESVDDYQAIPWVGNFAEVQRSYLQGGPTKELGDKHARLYKRLILSKRSPALVITHETRPEAALASLAKDKPLAALGESLGYLEGYCLTVRSDKLVSVETIRQDQSHEVNLPLEVLL